MTLRWLRHHLNALQIMALGVRLGVPRDRARRFARCWERIAHPLLYPSLGGCFPLRAAISANPAKRDPRVRG